MKCSNCKSDGATEVMELVPLGMRRCSRCGQRKLIGGGTPSAAQVDLSIYTEKALEGKLSDENVKDLGERFRGDEDLSRWAKVHHDNLLYAIGGVGTVQRNRIWQVELALELLETTFLWMEV